MKSKKWERLKGTKLSTHELDIVWRLWNGCLITFKIAKLMGLISTWNCAFCAQVNPDARHLVFCRSTDSLWLSVWSILDKMKVTVQKKERLFGYDESPLLNTILYIALVTIYKRFLYTINSGKIDFDLIKSYKQFMIILWQGLTSA